MASQRKGETREEYLARMREIDRKRRWVNPENRRAASREATQRWRDANPEKAREVVRRCRDANPERARELNRKYREANREKVREHKRKYREANREKVREHKRKWCEANREKVREHKRKWCEAGLSSKHAAALDQLREDINNLLTHKAEKQ